MIIIVIIKISSTLRTLCPPAYIPIFIILIIIVVIVVIMRIINMIIISICRGELSSDGWRPELFAPKHF